MAATLFTTVGAFIAPTEADARRLALAARVPEKHFRNVVPRAVKVAFDDTWQAFPDRVRLHAHCTTTALLFEPWELQELADDVAARYFREAGR